MPKEFEFRSDSHTKRDVSFTINGTTIQCVDDDLDGLTLLEFARIAGSIGQGSQIDPGSTEQIVASGLLEVAGQMLDLFRRVIVDDQWTLFEKTVKAPRSGVNAERLADVFGYLVEQYTNEVPSD